MVAPSARGYIHGRSAPAVPARARTHAVGAPILLSFAQDAFRPFGEVDAPEIGNA